MIDWSTYNRQLVKRGKILFEDELEEAKKKPRKAMIWGLQELGGSVCPIILVGVIFFHFL